MKVTFEGHPVIIAEMCAAAARPVLRCKNSPDHDPNDHNRYIHFHFTKKDDEDEELFTKAWMELYALQTSGCNNEIPSANSEETLISDPEHEALGSNLDSL